MLFRSARFPVIRASPSTVIAPSDARIPPPIPFVAVLPETRALRSIARVAPRSRSPPPSGAAFPVIAAEPVITTELDGEA